MSASEPADRTHVVHRAVVFATPWFDLVAKRIQNDDSPYYAVRTLDYVCVVARTRMGELLLVRQFRPAVERFTLELPSGHVEPGEAPELAARRELIEETGFRAQHFDLLARLAPDTGRLDNSLWCFYARDAVPVGDSFVPERGVEPILRAHAGFSDLIRRAEIDCALHVAALSLAVARFGDEVG